MQFSRCRIFISYRRSDTADLAGRLHDALKSKYGFRNVFLDVNDISTGEDFTDNIRRALEACDVFLMVIGDDWLEDNSRRRIDHPNDLVRMEIELAIKRGAVIIPVLANGAAVPALDDIPEDIRPAFSFHAAELNYRTFHSDVLRLSATIDQRFKLLKKERNERNRARRNQHMDEADLPGLVGLFLAGGIAFGIPLIAGLLIWPLSAIAASWTVRGISFAILAGVIASAFVRSGKYVDNELPTYWLTGSGAALVLAGSVEDNSLQKPALIAWLAAVAFSASACMICRWQKTLDAELPLYWAGASIVSLFAVPASLEFFGISLFQLKGTHIGFVLAPLLVFGSAFIISRSYGEDLVIEVILNLAALILVLGTAVAFMAYYMLKT